MNSSSSSSPTSGSDSSETHVKRKRLTKYNTEEERIAAKKLASHRWYERNRDRVIATSHEYYQTRKQKLNDCSKENEKHDMVNREEEKPKLTRAFLLEFYMRYKDKVEKPQ
jgi:hypothetical protein